MRKVAVLGGGINGVSCALKIKEKYNEFDVVLLSELFTPNTTGDGSGGLWNPYLCGETSEYKLTKWGGETYNFLHQLWLEGGRDICLMPVYDLYRERTELPRPVWADTVFGFQLVGGKQLDYLNKLYSANYSSGYTFSTFVTTPSSMITYLMQRFLAAGGKVVTTRIHSLKDEVLQEYQVIVNCLGLGARTVVPDDKMFPIRGQILRVNAPWIFSTVLDEDSGHYIIPNVETCVIGGTHQRGDYSTTVDGHDTQQIVRGCRALIPGLQDAEIVRQWVGLRPGRDSVRLEAEPLDDRLLIHNYGHGGSGFTLFWGCATQVLDLLDQYVNQTHTRIHSKL